MIDGIVGLMVGVTMGALTMALLGVAMRDQFNAVMRQLDIQAVLLIVVIVLILLIIFTVWIMLTMHTQIWQVRLVY